ncbi:hypothetical protein LTR08_004214 [Meristemomyces frigidus]|nr:hypothetical protein LTR08_004214 [Meristemomyces frigidus]
MDRLNGRDILEQFSLTVFEDRSLFDGAGTAVIREHFRHWAANAFRSEHSGTGEDVPRSPPAFLPSGHVPSSYAAAKGGAAEGTSPRYRFCVQVDTAALQSILYDAPAPPGIDVTKKGWVKLIEGDWTPCSENPRLRNRADPNVYDAIEGLTEDDVGWMKIPYQSIMTDDYLDFVDRNHWTVSYVRPPTVAGWPHNEETL